MNKYTIRKDVLALLIVIFIDALGWGLLLPSLTSLMLSSTGPILPPATLISTRNFWFEFTIAIYCFGIFIMSPFLGSLSDKIGRKKVLLLSMFGASIGPLTSAVGALNHSLFLVVLGRAIGGITAGSFPVAQAAIIDLSDEHTKARNLGYMVLTNSVGFALGPIVGGILLDQRLWHGVYFQLPFLVSAFFGIIGFLAVLRLFTETFVAAHAESMSPLESFINLFRSFTLPNLAPLLFIFLFGMTGYVAFFSNLPLWLSSNYQKSGAWIGYFLTYFAVLFSTSIIVIFPRLSKIFSLTAIMKFSLVIQMVCYLLFIVISNLHSVWWLVLAPAFGVPLMYVSLVTLLSNTTSSQHQGMIMGVASSVAALTWGIGPLLAGWSAGVDHNIGGFIVAAVLLGIALVLASRVGRGLNEVSTEP